MYILRGENLGTYLKIMPKHLSFLEIDTMYNNYRMNIYLDMDTHTCIYITNYTEFYIDVLGINFIFVCKFQLVLCYANLLLTFTLRNVA